MARGEQLPRVPVHLARWAETHPPRLPHTPRAAVTTQTARDDLDRYKLSLRRYDPKQAGLPWEMRSECPTCDTVVPSVFFMHEDQVVLSIRCPPCGETLEAHHDVLWTGAEAEPASPTSPTHTSGGSPISPVLHELPRPVETLCPECACNVAGRYYVKNGRVMIEKTCPAHGYFRDCINSDVHAPRPIISR